MPLFFLMGNVIEITLKLKCKAFTPALERFGLYFCILSQSNCSILSSAIFPDLTQNSRSRMFDKKVFLKFCKILKKAPVNFPVSYDFFEIFKNSFLAEHLGASTFVNSSVFVCS